MAAKPGLNAAQRMWPEERANTKLEQVFKVSMQFQHICATQVHALLHW